MSLDPLEYLHSFAEPKVTNILKCRLDFTTYVNKNIRHAPHTDLDDPHITTIFYVIDSGQIACIRIETFCNFCKVIISSNSIGG